MFKIDESNYAVICGGAHRKNRPFYDLARQRKARLEKEFAQYIGHHYSLLFAEGYHTLGEVMIDFTVDENGIVTGVKNWDITGITAFITHSGTHHANSRQFSRK